MPPAQLCQRNRCGVAPIASPGLPVQRFAPEAVGIDPLVRLAKLNLPLVAIRGCLTREMLPLRICPAPQR
jgi:hypothetical protein